MWWWWPNNQIPIPLLVYVHPTPCLFSCSRPFLSFYIVIPQFRATSWRRISHLHTITCQWYYTAVDKGWFNPLHFNLSYTIYFVYDEWIMLMVSQLYFIVYFALLRQYNSCNVHTKNEIIFLLEIFASTDLRKYILIYHINLYVLKLFFRLFCLICTFYVV